MSGALRIGICGYGNLGKGVELAAQRAADIKTVGIFTRRDPQSIKPEFQNKVYPYESITDFADEIDVMVICTGSKSDLQFMTPELTEYFNTVDSFDTHASIVEHFKEVDAIAKSEKKVSMISCGWDPGLFSIARTYFSAFLPDGKSYTFWGKGVSQGHSQAIREIEGVIDAKEYTIPDKNIVSRIKNGGCVTDTSKYHIRECYVVCSDNADLRKVYSDIVNMPDYFKGQRTIVHFISAKEMAEKHTSLPHGGEVLRIGKTDDDSQSKCKLGLTAELSSNPQFTGIVLCACARAVYKLALKGEYGCKSMLDVPPSYYLCDSMFNVEKLL